MTPYYSHAGITIYHGDCREVLPTLGVTGLVVADPPYGIGYRTAPSAKRPKSGATVIGDAEPFDPAHLLGFRRLVLFGANHYADKLPASPGWIVWDKRAGMPSNDQSDAELAWTNILGSVRVVRVLWNGGGSLLAENGPARMIHPTQKPIRLIRAVVAMLAVPGEVIIDPYMGTGTTMRAAKDLQHSAIGIEIEDRYCEIAARRLQQEVLFTEGVA